jgi:hypothetical protein
MRSFALVRSFVLVVIIASTGVSCTDVADPTKPDSASVLLQLTANQPRQSVFLYRTADLGETPSFLPFTELHNAQFLPYFLEGATVFVTDDHGRHPFQLRVDSSYGTVVAKSYVNPDSFVVQPEASYSLTVQAGTLTIEGRTTLPGEFQILSPSPTQIYTTSNGQLQFDLRWTRSRNALGYIASVIIARRVLVGGPYRERFTYVAFDTLYSPATPFRVSAADTCFVEVQSFDVNYYNHRFRSVASAGVSHGYGYVGSSVFHTVRVRFQ